MASFLGHACMARPNPPLHRRNWTTTVWIRDSISSSFLRALSPSCINSGQCKQVGMFLCLNSGTWIQWRNAANQPVAKNDIICYIICSSESVRVPLMWPGFDSRTWRHMWTCRVEFVVRCRLCSEGFSQGSPVFLPPRKPESVGSRKATMWKMQSSNFIFSLVLFVLLKKSITTLKINLLSKISRKAALQFWKKHEKLFLSPKI